MAAVPSAVVKQRERMQAELGLNADGSPIISLDDPPVVPAASEGPTPAPSPSPSDTSVLQARIQELEHLLETQNGRTSSSMRDLNDAKQRADILASQVASLEEGVAELRRQKETAEAQAAARQIDLPSFDVEEPTPEELQKFEPDSVGFINKLSKKQLIAHVKPLYEKLAALEKVVGRVSELDRLPQLERVVKDAQTETQRVKEEEFFRKEVLAYFPDFEKIRDTQEWKDYLTTDIPERGIKNHHLLHQYRQAQNAAGIRSFIQAHYDQIKAKPSLASLATPRGTQTEGSPVVKPRLKASDYNAKLKLWISKRLKQAEWDAYKSEFETARQENRVDMDARL